MVITVRMGGLTYQIEHHQISSMPRPALSRASAIVKQFCQDHHVDYAETGLLPTYALIVAYLNEVGKAGSETSFTAQ